VSRGIPRICRGEPRNLANSEAEFGKICRGKLWALVMTTGRHQLWSSDNCKCCILRTRSCLDSCVFTGWYGPQVSNSLHIHVSQPD